MAARPTAPPDALPASYSDATTADRLFEPPDAKRCTDYRRTLTASEYGVDRSTHDGLMRRCPRCQLASGRRSRGVHRADSYLQPDPEDRCAICGGDGGTRGLFLDHDHLTGRFRGWLCHFCNAGVGHFEDSPGLLARAITYLQAAAT